MKKSITGFTLIEVLLGILIFSIVIIGLFQVLSVINIGKIKLLEKTNLSKEMLFFTEKFFDMIKKGGTIDYEEYFNRKVVSIGKTNLFSSGHYLDQTGFGNFGNNGYTGTTDYGNGFYYCKSSTTFMGTGGCYDNNFNTIGVSVAGKTQRYGQYNFQFIDYNSNLNDDGGDENSDGDIRGDDDDENLGLGPIVFSGGVDVKEIYLITGDRKKRTLFRWNWKLDDDAPSGAICNSATFGTGCIGTIEFLVLDGKDWGLNHNSGSTSTGSFDGIIDTWLISPDFTSGDEIIAGSDDKNYRQPLFPNNISVKNFEVYLYPNINRTYAWKDNSSQTNINPYLRLKMTLVPSWKKRKAIIGEVPEFNINTTINLADYFTN